MHTDPGTSFFMIKKFFLGSLKNINVNFVYEENVIRILLYNIILWVYKRNNINIIIIPTDRPSRKNFLLVHLKIKLALPYCIGGYIIVLRAQFISFFD